MSIMLSVFVEHLGMLSPLEGPDRQAILSLSVTERRIPADGYIARDGTASNTFSVLVDGLAYCQKLTGFDGRQIVSLMIPGDALDLPTLFLKKADHDVRAFTNSKIALVDSERLLNLAASRPPIARAFLIKALIDASVSQEWCLNMGRRDGRTRVAHLLCEYMVRTKASGITIGDVIDFPLTQEQLGDATGLTSVHVNRMLKSLEADSLIQRPKGSLIRIPSLNALMRAGEFSDRYLHLRVGSGG